MCLECPVAQPAPPSGEHSSIDLCADSFADPAIAHVVARSSHTRPAAKCSVCYCVDFSGAEPKRAPPGCADPAHGWCAECALRALTTGGRRHYFVAKDRRTLSWAAYFCDGCRQSEQREA